MTLLAYSEQPPLSRAAPRYLFSLMDVGESAVINRDADTVRKSVERFKKKYPTWRFSVRKQTKETCKVWRTA